MGTFLRDVKHSIRMFLKSPGFTITALAALALGIGATTAIFSIVNTVLLKPLPVADADRLVIPMTAFVNESGANESSPVTSPAKFEFWRTHSSSVLQDLAALSGGVMNYTGGEVAEQLHSMQASAAVFRCWAIPMLEGRGFTQDEDSPSGPRVVVISKELWARRFASDPQMLGKTISLSGEAHTVVGIAGSAVGLREFGPLPDVYVPFRFDPNTTDQGNFFISAARLKPGVNLEQAKAAMQASTAGFRAKFPDVTGPQDRSSFTVETLREMLIGDIRPLLWVLLGAVGLVLLIACANVANLLLVRATGRRREIAIRTAIGAGRGRMIRQLLTDSALLSLAGGALGLLLGYTGIRALLAVDTAGLPMVGNKGASVEMDWRVAVFALVVSLVTGIVFGLLPAIQGSRVDLNSVLKESSGRSGTGLRQNKARAALVISEVGLAVVLLVGSALLIRTFVAMYKVERGFETKNIVTMRMSLTGPKFLKSSDAANAIRSGAERVRALPGVLAATATCCVPLEGGFDLNFDVIGRPPAGLAANQDVGWVPMSPGFFDVFKIPLKRGRTFTDKDDKKSQPVVVINETMARKYWKDGDPLKDRIVLGHGVMKEFNDEPTRQIVGIVGDVRDQGLDNEPRPAAYVPQAQLPDVLNTWLVRQAPMAWVVRTQTEPHSLIPVIQEQLRQATGLAVADVQSMDEVVSLSTGRQQFSMLLMTIFGAAALLLAAIGIYGLMAYTVEQRTQEIGIRLALGAEARQVRNMVVRQGMSLALAGVVVGIGAAWGLSRLIESLLFGVKARDPMVFVAVPAVLAAVALLAVWLPANRASRVSPVESLRYE
jgi:putative ABC transport system permease protein